MTLAAATLLFPAQPPPGPDPGCTGLSAALPWCVGKNLAGAPGQIAANAVRSGIDAVADSFTRSVQPFLTAIFTYWEQVPSADLASQTGPVALMQGSLHWLSQAIAVAALGIGAAKLVLSRRPEHAVGLGRAIGLLFFAAVVAVPLFNLLLSAGDEFSTYILNKATGGPFATTFVAFIGVQSLSALGSLTMILVSLAAVVGGFIQLVFMFIRNAALLVVVGTYPLAASAAATATGRAWFQKQTGWIIAFVAFKPVASIVYATAFLAIRDNKSTINVILGVVLIIVASVALPALMRVATPLTAAVAGSGGSGMGGLMGMAGAAATGAIAWKGRSSGSGGGSSAPRPNTPTGTNGGAGQPGANGAPGPRGGTGPTRPAAAGASTGGGGAGGGGGGGGGGVSSGRAAAGSSAGGAAAGGGSAAGGAAGGAAAGGAAAAGGPVGVAAAAAAKVAGQAAKTVRKGAEDATGAGGTQ